MHTLKPQHGVLLNPAHPLARNLIGCWLMSEGAGGKVYDCSPTKNTGTLQGNTCFASGRFGTGLSFDGSGDYVTIGAVKGTRATIALWCKPISDASVKGLYGYWENAGGSRLDIDIRNSTVYWTGVYNWSIKWDLSAAIDPTQWCHVCVQCGIGGARLYVNGRLMGSDSDEYCFDSWTASAHRIGWDFYGATDRYFNGTIDHVVMFNRTLAAGEIAQLYCEPFAMFKGSGQSRLAVVAGTTYRLLSGTVAAVSNLSARATARRRVTGTATAVASLASVIRLLKRVHSTCTANAGLSGQLGLAGVVDLAGSAQAATGSRASLSVQFEQRLFDATIQGRTPWLREVLFNALTSNSLQLGTVLTRGWFWTRRAGGSAIYRGRSLSDVDFTNSLCVVDANTPLVTVPSYIRHKPGLSYRYVVRRFNSCGYPERTTSAAVQLCIGNDGKRRQPVPNPIFTLTATPAVTVQVPHETCPAIQVLGAETI